MAQKIMIPLSVGPSAICLRRTGLSTLSLSWKALGRALTEGEPVEFVTLHLLSDGHFKVSVDGRQPFELTPRALHTLIIQHGEPVSPSLSIVN
jgi:hypothetical protein